MPKNKPILAAVLSIISAALIILYGIIILGTGFLIGSFEENENLTEGETDNIPVDFLGTIIMALSLWAIICGIVIGLGGLMLEEKPNESKKWGVIILVFSIISIFGGGGFFAGMILGIVGGVLAITWSEPDVDTSEELRTCLNCGRFVQATYQFCPYCGNKFE